MQRVLLKLNHYSIDHRLMSDELHEILSGYYDGGYSLISSPDIEVLLLNEFKHRFHKKVLYIVDECCIEKDVIKNVLKRNKNKYIDINMIRALDRIYNTSLFYQFIHKLNKYLYGTQ